MLAMWNGHEALWRTVKPELADCRTIGRSVGLCRVGGDCSRVSRIQTGSIGPRTGCPGVDRPRKRAARRQPRRGSFDCWRGGCSGGCRLTAAGAAHRSYPGVAAPGCHSESSGTCRTTRYGGSRGHEATNAGDFVALSDPARQRTARLYEEVRARPTEMSLITSRTWG